MGLHMVFAFLLAVGLALGLISSTSPAHAATLGAVALALGAVYLTGTLWENRVARSKTTTPIPQGLPLLWLGLLVTLWLVAVYMAPSFLWLVFPLVMVTMHLLPPATQVVGVGAFWVLGTGVYWWRYPEQAGPGIVLGPLMGVVFAAGTFLLYRALHREATTQAALAAQLLAAQEELRASEKHAGRMEERERLSREIHDTVAQSLSSIVLLARAAKTHPNNTEQLTLIEQQGQDALAEARRFVRDLAAPELEGSFLVSAKAVVDRHNSTQAALRAGLTIDLDVVGEQATDLPEPLARVGLRCIQEGLSNVAKHAKATRARVTVGLWEDHMSIDIADNGQGMKSAPTMGEAGYGLRGLRSRLEGVGGTLTIDSPTGGAGTMLTCRIPLSSKRDA